MIKPERMTKLRIIGAKSSLQKVIKEMYALGMVHIIEHNGQEIDIGSPLDNADQLSESLIAVRSILATLGMAEHKKLSNGFRAVGVKNIAQLRKKIETARGEVQEKVEVQKEFEAERKELQEKADVLATLSGMDITLESFTDYQSIFYNVGFVPDVKTLEKQLAGTEHEMLTKQVAGRVLVVIFAARNEQEKVQQVLSNAQFQEYSISAIVGMSGLPSENLTAFTTKMHALDKKEAKLGAELLALQKKWNDFLVLSEQFLDIEIEKAEAPLRFGSTENVFVASGWVPTKLAHAATVQLEKVDKNLVIESIDPTSKDAVPVKLNNPQPVQQFEFFLRMFALPKYNEIDPSIFIALSFPVFFGFILGDMGYGMTTFALFYFLKKKLPQAGGLLDIMMLSSISSFTFGMLFGEFFGAEVVAGHHLPHILGRFHQITELMIVAILVGVVHINIGLILGFINEWKGHGLKLAVLAKGSWWLVQAAAVLIALSAQGMIALPIYVGLAVLVVSGVMLFKGEGAQGIIELPGIFSNMLSYARLMAVGVASVGLAFVVNDFAFGMYASGGAAGIIGGTLILIIGHTINIGLGILGGFLHSLRLHYVEFFTKFYHGGAQPYAPFGNKEV